jgi:hypothetical protein
VRAALIALLLCAATAASAQPGDDDPAARLAAAQQALADGDHQQVVQLAGSVTTQQVDRTDLAEAHRLLGLAYFYLDDLERAEAELLAYLKLDLDARLDPTMVEPEAVRFFDRIRAEHAAELNRLRPRQKRYKLLNLIPPGGQLQNRQKVKAAVIGGLEVALLATNLTSFLVLRSWCQQEDFTCQRDGVDAPASAKRLKLVNYLSGVAFLGVYLYGVIDGFRGAPREREVVVGATPTDGGFVAGASISW